MIAAPVVLVVALAYLALLFWIAYRGDREKAAGQPMRHGGIIYALSIAVYCTSWTFYGSVSRASVSGLGFLPVYLGPTLFFVVGWVVLRKMVRIAQTYRITSIADFIASRHGKSRELASLVTVIALVGIMPYIALQLKAVAATYDIITGFEGASTARSWIADTAFWVAVAMTVFSILFGTRNIDATETHRGIMQAIAFESFVKLFAFVAVGVFAVYGYFDGFGDLFSRAAQAPETAKLMGGPTLGWDWVAILVASTLAIICLPRQFQVAVVENAEEGHIRYASWLFPLYLIAINLFVLPIALAGLLVFGAGTVDADTFVLALPLAGGHNALGLLVFIGGLSAATGMVIVATVALATMVSSELVMPLVIKHGRLGQSDGSLTGMVLWIRRVTVMAVMAFSYLFYRSIGESYALVSIGLMSFVAAAQFAPALIGGLYWKGGCRLGALSGLALGAAIWAYTLLLPSFARSGWIDLAFVQSGPFGLELLKPYALFGLDGLTPVAHSLYWSLFVNIATYVGVSLFARQTVSEKVQAEAFVDVYIRKGHDAFRLWRSTAVTEDLLNVTGRFLGRERAETAFRAFSNKRGTAFSTAGEADAELVEYAERLLAGAVGSASARVLVASAAKSPDMGVEQIASLLDEASEAIGTNRELLEATMENISQGMFVADREGRIAGWNNRLVEILDPPAEVLKINVPLSEFLLALAVRGEFGDGDPEQLVEDRLRHVRYGKPLKMERMRPNGVSLVIHGNPMPGGGYVVTFTDISDRRQAEEELRQLRNYLSNIINSMPSVLIGVDAEGTVTQWNKEASRYTGVSPENAIGQPLTQVYPHISAEMDQVRNSIRNREERTYLKRPRQLNGESRYEDMTIYPLVADGVEGVVIRVDDVTEQARMEEVMIQSEKMLSVGGLAAGMAHEINNPLAGMMQTASVMSNRLTARDIPGNQKVAAAVGTDMETIHAFMEERGILRMLAAINESGQRLAEIVDNMLSFARKSDTVSSYHNINEILDRTVELAATDYDLKKQYDFKTVEIVREYAESLSAVPCERAQMQQVLLNILRNGAEAMQEADVTKPTFTLRTRDEPELKRTSIEISDNGPGMDETTRKRIFEPFFTTKPVGLGTGLGLSVSYFIITENHGGEMSVESEPGKGARFKISLPYAEPS